MTKDGVQHLHPLPKIIPARVNILHLQLRDLLQPAQTPDRVLFVSRLKVEQADFASLKPTSVYCALDFQPNCLAIGCGLLAAGGQHGELALRPLHSPLSAATANTSEPREGRPAAPWLLRTPTGGSINNAISIQPDPSTGSSSSTIPNLVDPEESRRLAPWHRDRPATNTARPGLLFGDEEMESELSESVFQELAAAYGFDEAAVNRSSRWRRSPTALRSGSPAKADAVSLAPVKLMISNNDHSVKMYNLRPPRSTPGAGGRIEAGLPGLSRNATLHFPTAINHSSLSPDHRTLVSVGDTPDVFIHSVSRSGEYNKMATYSASSDACFSTSWSPDGSKFAVASQDGIVSVWDVRSSKRLAALSTSQASMTSGSGAARVVKFSPCGRYMAFTEHLNYFHISDTVTFTDTQRLSVPSLASFPAHESGVGTAASTNDVHAVAAQDEDDETAAGRRGSFVATTSTGRRFPLTGMMMDPGERFRVLSASNSSTAAGAATTAGQELTFRDRERRSIMHAAFMREWNRAINQVDLGLNPDPSSTAASAAAAAADVNTEISFTRSSSGTSSISPATNADIEQLLGSASRAAAARDWWTASSSSPTSDSPPPPALHSENDTSPLVPTRYRPDHRVNPETSRRNDLFITPHRENFINISGLCWDPDSEAVYVSSERLIARFPVTDPRRSYPSATFI